MSWAIFHQECNWSRPRAKFSFNAHASTIPQERPIEFIEYCVSKGWATKVQSPNKQAAVAIKPRKKRR